MLLLTYKQHLLAERKRQKMRIENANYCEYCREEENSRSELVKHENSN